MSMNMVALNAGLNETVDLGKSLMTLAVNRETNQINRKRVDELERAQKQEEHWKETGFLANAIQKTLTEEQAKVKLANENRAPGTPEIPMPTPQDVIKNNAAIVNELGKSMAYGSLFDGQRAEFSVDEKTGEVVTRVFNTKGEEVDLSDPKNVKGFVPQRVKMGDFLQAGSLKVAKHGLYNMYQTMLASTPEGSPEREAGVAKVEARKKELEDATGQKIDFGKVKDEVATNKDVQDLVAERQALAQKFKQVVDDVKAPTVGKIAPAEVVEVSGGAVPTEEERKQRLLAARYAYENESTDMEGLLAGDEGDSTEEEEETTDEPVAEAPTSGEVDPELTEAVASGAQSGAAMDVPVDEDLGDENVGAQVAADEAALTAATSTPAQRDRAMIEGMDKPRPRGVDVTARTSEPRTTPEVQTGESVRKRLGLSEDASTARTFGAAVEAGVDATAGGLTMVADKAGEVYKDAVDVASEVKAGYTGKEPTEAPKKEAFDVKDLYAGVYDGFKLSEEERKDQRYTYDTGSGTAYLPKFSVSNVHKTVENLRGSVDQPPTKGDRKTAAMYAANMYAIKGELDATDKDIISQLASYGDMDGATKERLTFDYRKLASELLMNEQTNAVRIAEINQREGHVKAMVEKDLYDRSYAQGQIFADLAGAKAGVKDSQEYNIARSAYLANWVRITGNAAAWSRFGARIDPITGTVVHADLIGEAQGLIADMITQSNSRAMQMADSDTWFGKGDASKYKVPFAYELLYGVSPEDSTSLRNMHPRDVADMGVKNMNTFLEQDPVFAHQLVTLARATKAKTGQDITLDQELGYLNYYLAARNAERTQKK